MQPSRNLEIGVGALTQWGGDGAPGATLLERLVDHLPGADNLPGVTPLQISNKFAAVDVRYRSGRAVLYAELQLDDAYWHNLRGVLTEDAGQVVGVSLPAVGQDAAWEIGAEGRRTGIRYYQHMQFRSGLTRERTLLGDPLGPNAAGGYLHAARSFAHRRHRIAVEVARERRSNHVFMGVADPFSFVKAEHRPVEWRDRALLAWTAERRTLRAQWAVRAGAERVRSFAYVAGDDRVQLLVEGGTTLRF